MWSIRFSSILQSFQIEKMGERERERVRERWREREDVCALSSKLVASARIALLSFNKGASKAGMHGAFGY